MTQHQLPDSPLALFSRRPSSAAAGQEAWPAEESASREDQACGVDVDGCCSCPGAGRPPIRRSRRCRCACRQVGQKTGHKAGRCQPTVRLGPRLAGQPSIGGVHRAYRTPRRRQEEEEALCRPAARARAAPAAPTDVRQQTHVHGPNVGGQPGVGGAGPAQCVPAATEACAFSHHHLCRRHGRAIAPAESVRFCDVCACCQAASGSEAGQKADCRDVRCCPDHRGRPRQEAGSNSSGGGLVPGGCGAPSSRCRRPGQEAGSGSGGGLIPGRCGASSSRCRRSRQEAGSGSGGGLIPGRCGASSSRCRRSRQEAGSGGSGGRLGSRYDGGGLGAGRGAAGSRRRPPPLGPRPLGGRGRRRHHRRADSVAAPARSVLNIRFFVLCSARLFDHFFFFTSLVQFSKLS